MLQHFILSLTDCACTSNFLIPEKLVLASSTKFHKVPEILKSVSSFDAKHFFPHLTLKDFRLV